MLLGTLFCEWLDDKLYMQKTPASAPAIKPLHPSFGGEEEYVGRLCWWCRRNSSWFRRHRTWVLHVQFGGCTQLPLGLDFFQWKWHLPNALKGVVVPLGDALVNIDGWQLLNLWVFPWAAHSVNERQVSLGKRGEKGVGIGGRPKCQPMVGHLCLLPISSELYLRYVYVFKSSEQNTGVV